MAAELGRSPGQPSAQLASDGVVCRTGVYRHQLSCTPALPNHPPQERGNSAIVTDSRSDRNPTAHEPKVEFPLSADNALHMLAANSMVHRRLHQVTVPPAVPIVA